METHGPEITTDEPLGVWNFASRGVEIINGWTNKQAYWDLSASARYFEPDAKELVASFENPELAEASRRLGEYIRHFGQ